MRAEAQPGGGRRLLLGAALLCAALAAFVVACGGARDGGGAAVAGAPVAGAAVSGEIVVSAASSLSDAFAELKTAFERAHPGTRVTLNLGASSALAVQINEGAPVDVFAAADAEQMAVVVNAGHASDPVLFATNRLVVARPAGSSAVGAFADLARPGVRLVLAAPAVPAGKYAREALARADASGLYGDQFYSRVVANVRSEEGNVRATLVKAELGEADAVIVYATDAAAAGGKVETLPLPAVADVPVRYLIATVAPERHAATARAFVDFVRAAAGQAILVRFGFGAAPKG